MGPRWLGGRREIGGNQRSELEFRFEMGAEWVEWRLVEQQGQASLGSSLFDPTVGGERHIAPSAVLAPI